MIAHGLHNLVPRSILAGRWVVVLVCYLDDSGSDPQNPITTIAGFIAKEDQWRVFETAVEAHFREYNVNILNTKKMHRTDEDFKGWTVLKKQFFVGRICKELAATVIQGLTISVVKDIYKVRATEYKRKRMVTPYSYCFNVIIDWVLHGTSTGQLSRKDGVAFVIEAGHVNNGEAERLFNDIRTIHKLENVLRSISFVGKDNCRAIQVADLLAFYSRRHGVAFMNALKKGLPEPREPMMSLLAESVPIRSFVASDFGRAGGLPSWRPPVR